MNVITDVCHTVCLSVCLIANKMMQNVFKSFSRDETLEDYGLLLQKETTKISG